MGVPGFFAWLLKQNNNSSNKKIVCSTIPNKPHALYLDANCLFHPQCFKILGAFTNETNVNKLETLMIKRIINYINYLIDFVQPTDLIYIAVDGVAPVAKINQQRKRRYKSIYDNEIKSNIMSKHNIPHNTNWSNIVITPGTKFMYKLDKELIKLVATNNKIIYSSYKEPGEGEHKILQYIKNNITDKIQVIYGLDADLIFLAFASNISNIFLLRENIHLDAKFKDDNIDKDPVIDVKQALCYVSIDNTIETLNNFILSKLDESYYDKLTNFKNDFIFICYFLGNDFIPHIPSIDIKKEGMDIIINAYIHSLERTGEYIIENPQKLTINKTTFKLFLCFLSDVEQQYFKEILPYYHNRKKQCRSTNPYDVEMWEFDNIINITNQINVSNKDLIYDPFHLMELSYDIDKSKTKYYKHYFKNYKENNITNIVDDFYKILYWVLDYYFNLCHCWITHYKYNHSPFISDIYKYMDLMDNYDGKEINNNPPITINQQLISVIPPQYKNILDKNLQIKYNDEKLKPLLPEYSRMDFHYKDMFWLVELELPYLDINIIKNID